MHFSSGDQCSDFLSKYRREFESVSRQTRGNNQPIDARINSHDRVPIRGIVKK